MAKTEGRVGGRGRGIRLPGLRRARTEAGYSMRALEADSGVARSTIWHLEEGERGAQSRTVSTLAECLKVPPHALTREPGDAPPADPDAESAVHAVGVVSEEDFIFAALRAPAEGVSEDEALGRILRERRDRPARPAPRPREQMPKIPAGGLTAAAAVSADR